MGRPARVSPSSSSAHGATVLGLCRVLLRNGDEAEDAVQQTFLSAYREPAERRRAAASGRLARDDRAQRVPSADRETDASSRSATPSPRARLPDPVAAAAARADLQRALAGDRRAAAPAAQGACSCASSPGSPTRSSPSRWVSPSRRSSRCCSAPAASCARGCGRSRLRRGVAPLAAIRDALHGRSGGCRILPPGGRRAGVGHAGRREGRRGRRRSSPLRAGRSPAVKRHEPAGTVPASPAARPRRQHATCGPRRARAGRGAAASDRRQAGPALGTKAEPGPARARAVSSCSAAQPPVMSGTCRRRRPAGRPAEVAAPRRRRGARRAARRGRRRQPVEPAPSPRACADSRARARLPSRSEDSFEQRPGSDDGGRRLERGQWLERRPAPARTTRAARSGNPRTSGDSAAASGSGCRESAARGDRPQRPAMTGELGHWSGGPAAATSGRPERAHFGDVRLARRRRQRGDPDDDVAGPSVLAASLKTVVPLSGSAAVTRWNGPFGLLPTSISAAGAGRVGRDDHPRQRPRLPASRTQSDAGLSGSVVVLGLPERRGVAVDCERGEVVVLVPVALGVVGADRGELDASPGFPVVVVVLVGVVRPGRGRRRRRRLGRCRCRLVITMMNNTTKNAASAPAASRRFMSLSFCEDGQNLPKNPGLYWLQGPADVAQLVEHFTRNEGVPGSSPGVGSSIQAVSDAPNYGPKTVSQAFESSIRPQDVAATCQATPAHRSTPFRAWIHAGKPR